MTDTIKNDIEFYKTIEYDNIDYPVYKVINKKNIDYVNNKEIFYSSPTGQYIVLYEDIHNVFLLLDFHKFMFLNHSLY